MQENEFDPKALLEELLSTTKQYVEKGQALAEQKLDIPESGEERAVMLQGLKKGALASAVLIGLLGTSGGRKLTKSAVKIGGIAALGKIGGIAALGTAAYKGYKNWQETGDVMGGDAASPVNELTGSDAEGRSLLLIEALVAAANADGKLDDEEQKAIKHQILEMHLPGEMAMTLENIIDSPLSAGELAQKVSSQAEASEVYIATNLLRYEPGAGERFKFTSSLSSLVTK